ncbi:MAG: DNA replication complex GINS family protein [Candidatus Methylarchaceae archaeon HK01M]|nr:DNA replication complex GINS family protein [Candidatus Methylarchaceae archaeon HK01M]
MSKIEKESSVIGFLKDCEAGFLLVPVKAVMKQGLPPIEIGSVSQPETNEGDIIEVPRWVAEVMVQMDFAEIQEESFDVELFKALSRECMQDSSQPSTLKSDFYHRIRRQITLKKSMMEIDSSLKGEYEKFLAKAYDLIALRTSKLSNLACLPSLSPDLEKKLTSEEKKLFESIHSLVEDWKKSILGE